MRMRYLTARERNGIEAEERDKKQTLLL
jgi:hypothetical protein